MSAESPSDPVGPAAPAVPAGQPSDHWVRTEHTLPTTEGELAYSVRTGRIVVGEEHLDKDVYAGWQPRAEMAVTAYTLDGADSADRANRPVAFIFNGGPGSSSLWLHVGVLGPRVVETGEPNEPSPPPYTLIDNPHTLLRAADLVFIDPMSTGHSRAVTGGKPGDYHAFDKDIAQVAEVIRLWCTREDRWMSPKFVCGESYGTTRAVGVAAHLFEQFGMQLNGLVLISSVLDFATLDFEFVRNDLAYQLYLPTYAAVAHYHGFHGERPLAEVIAEAEHYANGRYRWALGHGNRLTAAERDIVINRVSELTGLSPAYVDRCNLRPEHWRFCTELLRERGETVGRLDGRIRGTLQSGIAENMDADPSFDAITGPFAAAIHHYLRAELGCELDLPYAVISREASKQWKWPGFEAKPINVLDRLERLLRANPHLQVRVEYGYYDLATPYAAALDALAHLDVPPAALARIEHAYFETGHMPYVGAATRDAEADGITDFVRRASLLAQKERAT